MKFNLVSIIGILLMILMTRGPIFVGGLLAMSGKPFAALLAVVAGIGLDLWISSSLGPVEGER